MGAVEFNVGTLAVACMTVIIGFQLVAFAFYTKVFAIAEGLLPDDPKLTRVFKIFTLEKGIVAGLLVLLAGTILFLRALWIWKQADYRPSAIHGGKFAAADSGGHARRHWCSNCFFQFLHERLGPENRLAQTANAARRLEQFN